MNKLTTIFLLLIIIVFASFFWWRNGTSPANSNNKTPVIFVIQKGSGLKEIASKLKEAKLIKSRIIFFLYTRLGKYD